jgi:hypothetical protein
MLERVPIARRVAPREAALEGALMPTTEHQQQVLKSTSERK